MDNYELLLSKEAEDNVEGAIDTLVEAACDIATKSEKDFERIKEKPWYKRLWELITFSKDNEKIQARGVANLAKLNEIVMKAIVLLSKQSKNNAERICEALQQIKSLTEDVGDLYSQQETISKTILIIRRGFESEGRFDELSENQRDIIYVVLRKYAIEGSNEDTRKLLSVIAKQSHDTYDEVGYDVIKSVNSDSFHKILFSILQLYSHLLNDTLPDEQHELFQYIKLSEQEKKAIRKHVEEDIQIYGSKDKKDKYDKYIETFYSTTEEYDIFVDVIDVDWDFEDEDAFESDDAPKDKPEMETVHVNKLTQIRSGERLQFYKKNVYIEANIDCHGELEFFGCNIYYNAGTSIGKITLSPESQLNIWNSHVLGGSLDETAFVRGEQADISCLNSTFHNCQRFINVTDSEFYMDKCGVCNCIREFVCVDNGTNCSVENTLIKVDDPAIIASEITYKKENSGLSSPKIFDIDRWCEYKNNLFYCPLELVDSLWLTVFWGDNHSVEHCTFITLGHQSIHYSYNSKTISNSLFVGGSSVIRMDGGGELTTSMFINCENAVECSSNKINSCYFVDCCGPTIRNSISGGAIIDDCIFLNTKHIPKSEKTHWLIDTLSCIHVGCNIGIMGKGYNKPNEIRNCLFHGLTQYENIIAPDGGYSKPEDTIAIIDSCRFINCDCINTVKTDVVYHSEILNIKKTAKNVMQIINCEGVSNKNWLREPTQYFSKEMADIELSGKQWGCDFLHSDFYMEHNLNTDERITPWIKDYEARVISETK